MLWIKIDYLKHFECISERHGQGKDFVSVSEDDPREAQHPQSVQTGHLSVHSLFGHVKHIFQVLSQGKSRNCKVSDWGKLFSVFLGVPIDNASGDCPNKQNSTNGAAKNR